MYYTIEGAKTTIGTTRHGWRSPNDDWMGDLYGTLPHTVPPLLWWATESPPVRPHGPVRRVTPIGLGNLPTRQTNFHHSHVGMGFSWDKLFDTPVKFFGRIDLIMAREKSSHVLVKFEDNLNNIDTNGFRIMSRKELESWKRKWQKAFPTVVPIDNDQYVSYERIDEYKQTIQVVGLDKNEAGVLEKCFGGKEWGLFVDPVEK